eukprot:TRINITY_DN3773_c0_g1_i3.p1 TRINITY_DN3773_c0_g1~~TRINITY_DN3773_c0_g1_i3.p1  ORF type:complete len:100 (-),score=18.56 TRINITY_DN3773_c0_g1_i3:61-360(-)
MVELNYKSLEVLKGIFGVLAGLDRVDRHLLLQATEHTGVNEVTTSNIDLEEEIGTSDNLSGHLGGIKGGESFATSLVLNFGLGLLQDFVVLRGDSANVS